MPLEDIFHGCTRTVRHTRSLTTLQDDGSPQAVTEERTLLVSIAPGTPDGTRYVFEGCVVHMMLRTVRNRNSQGGRCHMTLIAMALVPVLQQGWLCKGLGAGGYR